MDRDFVEIQMCIDHIYEMRMEVLEHFRIPLLSMFLSHTYNWKNNSKRKSLFGKQCRILAVGKMNSVLVEFENGNKEIISRRALRRI